MPECKIQRNNARCPFTYPGCSRKGICCDCIAHHLASRELPACCFPPEVERKYDRSFEEFIRCHSGK